MSGACDLCGKDIMPGEPRYGMVGGHRHWACHVAKHGAPAAYVPTVAQVRAPDPAILTPKVRKGAYNRSANAQREFVVLERMREMGKTRARIECPFCFARFWAFVWSISGGGKKCPNCGAIHASFGVAYPIEGNEDL